MFQKVHAVHQLPLAFFLRLTLCAKTFAQFCSTSLLRVILDEAQDLDNQYDVNVALPAASPKKGQEVEAVLGYPTL